MVQSRPNLHSRRSHGLIPFFFCFRFPFCSLSLLFVFLFEVFRFITIFFLPKTLPLPNKKYTLVSDLVETIVEHNGATIHTLGILSYATVLAF